MLRHKQAHRKKNQVEQVEQEGEESEDSANGDENSDEGSDEDREERDIPGNHDVMPIVDISELIKNPPFVNLTSLL